MRNRQIGPDTATDILADLVPRISYKPSWRFELKEIDRGQGSGGLTLMISAEVYNSNGDGTATNVLHLMPVLPAAYDRDTWVRWLLDQILLVEQHEALEFFRIDGGAPYHAEHAPGRNPYTVAEVKSREQLDIPATPWTGGKPKDPHFAP